MHWVVAAIIVHLVLFGELGDTKNDCPSSSDPPESLNCSNLVSKWRTINGSCNNDVNGTWGAAGQVYNKFVVSEKSNDTDTLRKSVTGKDLPNPRVVSTTIHTDQNFTSNVINQFFAFFGLFVVNDIQKTVVPSSSGCCNKNSQKSCFPIAIPANDTFYKKFGLQCLEYVRSCRKEGKVGSPPTIRGRFQFNDNTVFLDLSQIYGSDETKARKLRTFSNGRLKTFVASDGQELLPAAEQAGMSESVSGPYAVGDSLGNFVPQLTAIYTIFVLEHNRIAMELHASSSAKTDEWLYQQARRILISVYQNIIYREYLPILIGEHQMLNFGLPVYRRSKYHSGFYTSISNGNADAGNMHMFSSISGTMEYGLQKIPLHETFSNSSYLHAPSGLLRVIQGMSAPAQDFDRFVTAELTNHFLQPKNQQYGQDFVAFALQRGRDHKLGTYVDVVKRCSRGRLDLKQFSDLVKHGLMDNSNVELLKQVYADARDIDLFTGGLSEKRSPGAVLGATMACLQGIQFNNLKYGDRLFFTDRHSFTEAQYAQIFAISLKNLVCRNVKGYPESILEMQLLLPSDGNKLVSCKKIPKLDLSLFSD